MNFEKGQVQYLYVTRAVSYDTVLKMGQVVLSNAKKLKRRSA